MKILVIGKDGQLARALKEIAAGRPELGLFAVGRPEVDLEVSGSVAEAIRSAKPDVVINAAAYTAVDQAENEPGLAFGINVDAAGEVAEVAHEVEAAIIQLSTDYVFDGRSEAPYSEDAPTNPLNIYGRSKLAGEEAVRGANPDHVIVRTAWLYSPFGRNFVRTMVGAARTHDNVRVVADQLGNPTSALDLADGLLTMLGRWRADVRVGLGETYHLAGSGTTSWFGLAEQVMDSCRRHGLPSAEVEPIATADWPAKAIRPRNSAVDSRKFARDFGFVMPDWRQSVDAVIRRLASGEG